MTIDYDNLPLDESSIEAAAADTRDFFRVTWFNAVYYDTRDGKVWAKHENENDYTVFGPSVLTVLRRKHKISAKRIRTAIAERLELEKELQAEVKAIKELEREVQASIIASGGTYD